MYGDRLKEQWDHLVDAQDRCGKVPAQAVQCGAHGEHLSGPLLPLSGLELTPEHSCHRIQHHQADQTPGQQEGDPARQTQLEGVLRVKASLSALTLFNQSPTSEQHSPGRQRAQHTHGR